MTAMYPTSVSAAAGGGPPSPTAQAPNSTTSAARLMASVRTWREEGAPRRSPESRGEAPALPSRWSARRLRCSGEDPPPPAAIPLLLRSHRDGSSRGENGSAARKRDKGGRG